MTDAVLVYAINRTDAWWRHIAASLGFAQHHVVTDIRGAGDSDVIDAFYGEYRRQRRLPAPSAAVLTADEVADVVARCRVLRWLPANQAHCMVVAMEHAFSAVLDQTRPSLVLSFPIDRYVSDVLERLACKRGIPYVELTVSLISGMCMLMYRGQLLKTGPAPAREVLQQHVSTIANPSFTPSYVQTTQRYTAARWLKIFSYFRVRGWAFRAISWLKRDPVNLHYTDAQAFLGHKPRLSDLAVLDLIDWNWRDRLAPFAQDRRVFLGLQLFPEASIDYWLANLELIDYEDLVVDAARAYADAGWLVLVKDHPSQFGFRQRGLIDRLLGIPNVVFLPYDVSGNEVVSLTGANFTLTGTLGLQSALLGRKSVASPTYYVTTPDFVTFDRRSDVAGLPARTLAAPPPSLLERQHRVIAHLLQGSFEGDFFSFRGFQSREPASGATLLAKRLGERLRELLAQRTHPVFHRPPS
ncbi:MAG: hypothetical protein ACKVQR_04765 [Aquabacterium sp.]